MHYIPTNLYSVSNTQYSMPIIIFGRIFSQPKIKHINLNSKKKSFEPTCVIILIVYIIFVRYTSFCSLCPTKIQLGVGQ